MAKYYALVAGLPDLTVDSQKLAFGQEEFYQELRTTLTAKDMKLLQALRLEQTNATVLSMLLSGELSPKTEEQEVDAEDESGLTALLSALRSLAISAYEEQAFKQPKGVPAYLARFVYDYYAKADEDVKNSAKAKAGQALSQEDLLAQAYFTEMLGVRNPFLAQWFKLNQTLRNVLVLHTCRKLGWKEEDYIVGDSEIEEKLRTSKAKDFDLSEEVPQILEIVQIAEEKDISKRERMIDVLKWRWLEEQTFAKVFDIESVLTYYLRIGIVERWLKLDKETGEKVFREIVFGLKKESNKSLEEFKNNIKR